MELKKKCIKHTLENFSNHIHVLKSHCAGVEVEVVVENRANREVHSMFHLFMPSHGDRDDS